MTNNIWGSGMTKPVSSPWAVRVEPNWAFANLAVQFYFMALERHRLATQRFAAVATGSVPQADEMRHAFTERLAAWREATEIMFNALLGGRKDLGMGSILQLYRKKLRAGERRLKNRDGHDL